MAEQAAEAVRVLISGRVQGIGFRYWMRTQAEARGLDGWVRNLRDGRVEAVFQGPAVAVEAMVVACHEGPMGARVSEVQRFEADPLPTGAFEVRPSALGPEGSA